MEMVGIKFRINRKTEQSQNPEGTPLSLFFLFPNGNKWNAAVQSVSGTLGFLATTITDDIQMMLFCWWKSDRVVVVFIASSRARSFLPRGSKRGLECWAEELLLDTDLSC